MIALILILRFVASKNLAAGMDLQLETEYS